MAVGAAAALGRAALARAATRKGRLWMLALILVGVTLLAPVLVMLAFYSVATHVLKHVAVAPPGWLAIDAYRAAEVCPFATDGDAGRALGTAFLVGSAWVLTSDGGRQFGGYRNPVGDPSHVPADMRPGDPAELAPGGGVHNVLGLPARRTVKPQDWTSVVPLSGEYGVGFLLITPSDWRNWVRDVPASVSRPLDPYRPYDAFVVMACHLRTLEQHAGVDPWGAMALWAVPQVLAAEVNRNLSRGLNVRQIIDGVMSDLQQLVSGGVSLGAQFASAVADFMGQGAMGTAALTMGQVQPSATALREIPPRYLQLIRKWAAAYGIDWTVLAGVLSVEDDFGRGSGVSSAGALGPAQFMPATFAQYGVDDRSDGKTDAPDIWNPADAIASAANYLKALGAGNPSTVRSALCRYEGGGSKCMAGSDPYADKVMSRARQYRGAATTGAVTVAQGTGASPRVQTAINFARAQLGKPYVWGGTGPSSYDCSGLVQAAYRSAGISLPRTSQEQWAAGPRVGTPHQPGDLVFFTGSEGSPGRPGHVGMAINATQMIVAPHTGDHVKIQTIYSEGYVGATRPAARTTVA